MNTSRTDRPPRWIHGLGRGQRLDIWELSQLLGYGPRGAVFEAFDLMRERVIALRVFPLDHRHENAFLERLFRLERLEPRDFLLPIYGGSIAEGFGLVAMPLLKPFETLASNLTRAGDWRLDRQEEVLYALEGITPHGCVAAHNVALFSGRFSMQQHLPCYVPRVDRALLLDPWLPGQTIELEPTPLSDMKSLLTLWDGTASEPQLLSRPCVVKSGEFVPMRGQARALRQIQKILKAGRGRVIVQGEPGAGKSRLLQEISTTSESVVALDQMTSDDPRWSTFVNSDSVVIAATEEIPECAMAAERVVVSELSRSDVESLIRDRVPDADPLLVDAVCRYAGGNPAVVHGVLDSLSTTSRMPIWQPVQSRLPAFAARQRLYRHHMSDSKARREFERRTLLQSCSNWQHDAAMCEMGAELRTVVGHDAAEASLREGEPEMALHVLRRIDRDPTWSSRWVERIHLAILIKRCRAGRYSLAFSGLETLVQGACKEIAAEAAAWLALCGARLAWPTAGAMTGRANTLLRRSPNTTTVHVVALAWLLLGQRERFDSRFPQGAAEWKAMDDAHLRDHLERCLGIAR